MEGWQSEKPSRVPEPEGPVHGQDKNGNEHLDQCSLGACHLSKPVPLREQHWGQKELTWVVFYPIYSWTSPTINDATFFDNFMLEANEF